MNNAQGKTYEKNANNVSKLLHKILNSMKIVYEIAKVVKSIFGLFKG